MEEVLRECSFYIFSLIIRNISELRCKKYFSRLLNFFIVLLYFVLMDSGLFPTNNPQFSQFPA